MHVNFGSFYDSYFFQIKKHDYQYFMDNAASISWNSNKIQNLNFKLNEFPIHCNLYLLLCLSCLISSDKI